MKILLPLCLFLSFSCAAGVKVYYPKEGRHGEYAELIKNLPHEGYIVLGEFHYDAEIQKMEAKIIEDALSGKETQSTLGWEFLDHTDQSKIDSLVKELKNKKMSAGDFLKSFFKQEPNTYSPVLEVVQNTQIDLIGLNVPRSFKQLLIKDGISSLPSEIIPPNMTVGDDNYLKRFKASMEGHVPAEKIQRYFEAQCLTDSAMAYVLSEKASELNFVIAGSFHTDYFSGTVSRLKRLINSPIIVIKIINAKVLNTDEISEIKRIHPDYGAISDAIVILD